MKQVYENSKYEMSAPMWNDKLELPDGSYSVWEIQVYYECIIKSHERVTDNSRIKIYVKINIYYSLTRLAVSWINITLVKCTKQISTHNTAQYFDQFD